MRNRTYRYFNGPVLYPFGYGLSYTTFAYSDPQLAASEIRAGAPATASVAVRNTGKMAGEEVVELYVAAPGDSGVEHPSLAGFTRAQLAPGESKRVSIDIDPRWISRVDDKGERHIEAGEYTLWLGGGQPGKAAGTEVKLQVKGSADLPH
jgi:beta-glucosidase